MHIQGHKSQDYKIYILAHSASIDTEIAISNSDTTMLGTTYGLSQGHKAQGQNMHRIHFCQLPKAACP